MILLQGQLLFPAGQACLLLENSQIKSYFSSVRLTQICGGLRYKMQSLKLHQRKKRRLGNSLLLL